MLGYSLLWLLAMATLGLVGDVPAGFAYELASNGDIAIRHNGSLTTAFRAGATARFLVEVADGDEPALLAR